MAGVVVGDVAGVEVERTALGVFGQFLTFGCLGASGAADTHAGADGATGLAALVDIGQIGKAEAAGVERQAVEVVALFVNGGNQRAGDLGVALHVDLGAAAAGEAAEYGFAGDTHAVGDVEAAVGARGTAHITQALVVVGCVIRVGFLATLRSTAKAHTGADPHRVVVAAVPVL